MDSDKRGFDNAAMTGEHPPVYNQPPAGYGQPVQQYGYNQPAQQYGYNQPVQYAAPPVVVATAVMPRETGPRPDTTSSLVASILSLIFCIGCWPFAVVAIIFNRKASNQADLGQYTAARSALKTTYIFIGVTVVLGIIAWIIFAIRLKYTLDTLDDLENDRRNFRECTPTVKAATYKTMVRPVVEYASTVWNLTGQGDIAALEQVQRRAARFVYNYTDRTLECVTSMLDALKWEPLQQHRANNRLLMLYRIVNTLVDVEPSKFFCRSDPRTRGAKRLFQEHTRRPVLHTSFFSRTIRDWNSLPASLTDSTSLESFKQGLGCSPNLGLLP